jgi:hypothetical protein
MTVRRSDEIYESQIRSPLKPDNHGKIVAIALETEVFEVDLNQLFQYQFTAPMKRFTREMRSGL